MNEKVWNVLKQNTSKKKYDSVCCLKCLTVLIFSLIWETKLDYVKW